MNTPNSSSLVPKFVSLKLNRSTVKFMVYLEDMQNINPIFHCENSVFGESAL